MVKQKLRDYPRSIETASYMVASEWWDSSGDSRQEKCGLLLDTVKSMGKKCTAQRLENVVQENMLSLTNTNRILGRTSNSSCAMRNPRNNTAYNEIQNGNAAVCGSASVIAQGNRGNLAICNGETVMEPDNNVGEMNIEEVVDVEASNQGPIDESGGYEINYSFPEETGNPSVENEAVDLFEGEVSPINSGQLEMTDSPTDTVRSEQSLNDESGKYCVACDQRKIGAYQDLAAGNAAGPNNPIASNKVQTIRIKSIGLDRPMKLNEKNDGNDFRNEEAFSTTVTDLANIQQQPRAHCDAWFDIFEYENTESEDEMFCSSEKKFEIESLDKKMYRPSHGELESDDDDNDMFSSQNPRFGKSCSGSDKSSEIKPYFADKLSSQVRIRNTLSHKTLSQKPFDESKASANYLGKDEKDGK